MFIGHYALALTAKKNNPLPSLAMMFVAVQFLDLLWPVFLLTGIETFEIDPGNTVLTPLNFTHYPWSHSLLMSIIWGIALGVIYNIVTGNRKGAKILGLLVVSHWLLDFITHRSDLPLTPFTEVKVGLGLWNTPVTEILLEGGMFFSGTLIYFNSVKPKRKVAYWSLIAVLAIIHIANMAGPPPPSVMAVAWSANLMWLFVLWAWWIERK